MAAWCDLAVEVAVLNDTDALVGGESNLLEAAVLNDTYSEANPGIKAIEAAVLNDTYSTLFVSSNRVIERGTLNDNVDLSTSNEESETAVLNDTNAWNVAQVVVEAAMLGDTYTATAAKTTLAVEVAALNDSTDNGMGAFYALAEIAVLNDTVSERNNPVSLAVETAVLNDTTGTSIFDYHAETAVLNDTTLQHLVGYNLAVDYLYFSDDVTGAGAGGAWVTNLDTMPMSRYTNQPWQSMAAVNGTVLMADGDGLYKRSGNTDAGLAISASVSHDLIDRVVGKDGKAEMSPHIKRPRHWYLNYISDGPLLLTLGHIAGTAEVSGTSTLPQSSATQFVNGRVDPGRGIRSRYLRPAIANVAGDNFHLGDSTIIVDNVDRRI